MPDSEAFKVIIQLGSFGLLAVIAVWLLWKGAPMLVDALKRLADGHAAVVAGLTKDCSDERAAMRGWLSEEMDKRDESYRLMAASLDKLAGTIQCRRPS